MICLFSFLVCPNHLHSDGSRTYCYSLPSDDIKTKQQIGAETICTNYDSSAQLAVVDTAQKFATVKAILSGVKSQCVSYKILVMFIYKLFHNLNKQ